MFKLPDEKLQVVQAGFRPVPSVLQCRRHKPSTAGRGHEADLNLQSGCCRITTQICDFEWERMDLRVLIAQCDRLCDISG